VRQEHHGAQHPRHRRPAGRIESGEIWLRGVAEDAAAVDLARLAPNGAQMRAIRGKEIALIFQEPMASFSHYYTVGNQIMEAIRQHSDVTAGEAHARAIDLLRIVGVPQPERRVDEYPFQLSGGLRQRVMIAMALACDPRVLIADEPTTALDVTTQAQILDLLRALQAQRGLALILITHDMGVIAEMADDVVVMYLGRAVEKGASTTSSTHRSIPIRARSCARSRASWRRRGPSSRRLAAPFRIRSIAPPDARSIRAAPNS